MKSDFYLDSKWYPFRTVGYFLLPDVTCSKKRPQFIRENHPSVVCDSVPEFQHFNDLPSVPGTQAENTYFPASFGHFGMPELHYIFGFDQNKMNI